MEGRGFIFSMCGQSCSCSGHSSTSARFMASARFSEEMSQPGGHGVTQALGVSHLAVGSPPCPTYRRRRCRWGAPWAAGPGRARRRHRRGRCPGTRWRLGAGSRSSWLSGMGRARMRGWQGEEGVPTPPNWGLGLRSRSAGAGRRSGCRTRVQLSLVSPSLWDGPGSQGSFWGHSPCWDPTGVLLGTPRGHGPCRGHTEGTHSAEVTLGTPTPLRSLWGHPLHRGHTGDTPLAGTLLGTPTLLR